MGIFNSFSRKSNILSCGAFIACMIGFTQSSNATVHHTIYVAHPNANSQPEAGSDNDHSYLQEILRLRESLTEIAPIPAPPQETLPSPMEQDGATANAGEEPLRVTRRGRDYSIVRMAALNEDNSSSLQYVDLVVRNNDLYVLGFINGREGHRIFHRMHEPIPYQRSSDATMAIPLNLEIPGTRAVDLELAYDYPCLERKANMRRYGGNFRSSMRTVRAAISSLAEHNPANDDEDSVSEVARSLLRVIVTYFEGMRFHSLAQGIHDAGFDNGRTWTMTQEDALITNNWRSLTEFGSQMSLDRTSRSSSSSPRFELPRSGGSPYGSRYFVTSSMSDDATNWRNILAVALVSQWGLTRRGSCPSRLGYRSPRDTNSLLDFLEEEACSVINNVLVRVGNTYFDRARGHGILMAIVDED